MNTEKRLRIRKPINTAVRVNEANGYYHDAFSSDVSMNGMAVFTGKNDIEAGEIYCLKFDLPVRGRFMNVNLDAKVVHATSHGSYGHKVGFEFVQIDTLSTWTLEAFVKATDGAKNAVPSLHAQVWGDIDNKSKKGSSSS
ncbi:MAG: PilZ domain-containing protein [Pseudomonadota bacterium]